MNRLVNHGLDPARIGNTLSSDSAVRAGLPLHLLASNTAAAWCRATSGPCSLWQRCWASNAHAPIAMTLATLVWDAATVAVAMVAAWRPSWTLSSPGNAPVTIAGTLYYALLVVTVLLTRLGACWPLLGRALTKRIMAPLLLVHYFFARSMKLGNGERKSDLSHSWPEAKSRHDDNGSELTAASTPACSKYVSPCA